MPDNNTTTTQSFYNIDVATILSEIVDATKTCNKGAVYTPGRTLPNDTGTGETTVVSSFSAYSNWIKK